MSSTTTTPPSNALYVSRKKIHPKAVKGTFRRVKNALNVLLLTVFYVTPWLTWNRGPGAPDQAVLLDLEGQRGYIFFIEFWPQEIYLIAGALIIGVGALFMTASLAGRVWCGFTCPQTVFTDIFIRVERLFEGDRAARLRLDKQPLTLDKALRKTGKHLVWALIALSFAVTFTFYFVETSAALESLVTLNAGPWMWTTLIVLGSTTYILAGWAREQMCNYMCPWPRLQSSMLDEHSLVVTYQAWRGDARAPKRKSQSWEERAAAGYGDCIACNQCVQVCPIGIDIRDGANADCINCGLCIDACNNIMDNVGRPRGLIRFDSFANDHARSLEGARPTRILRPKTYAYLAVLCVGVAALAFTYSARSLLEVTAIKNRAPLFVTLSDGSIRNTYTLKLSNKMATAKTLELSIDGLPGAKLELIGATDTAGSGHRVQVRADTIDSYKAFISAPPSGARPDTLTLSVRDPDTGIAIRETLAFSWPQG